LIELLHEKATFAMPPMGVWYTGYDVIQRALQNFVFLPGVKWKTLPASANGRSAFGIYQHVVGAQLYQASGLILPIFSAEDGQITEITAFMSPALVNRFGLPQTWSP
jgi:RNA polymerase sigma-70 factor (ECF subfamily)